jgi:NAD(P)-dependent dehydrogenase (short-subunit alcohol dehydrogenase family)
MRSFVGRIAVVTGAGSGIGRATSERLAQRGCRLALVDIDADAVDATARRVKSAGGEASVHVVDVADADAMAALAEHVLALHGGCHILVNDAGITSAGSFEKESLDDLRAIVGVNVWGAVHGCRAFLPLLRDAEEAHIVNISSMVGMLGLPYNASYSLSKGAVRSFTEALRAELITTSIGVTAVFPARRARTSPTRPSVRKRRGWLAWASRDSRHS